MKEIITSNWLKKNLDNKNIVVFDSSWYMPSEKRSPYNEYLKEHIQGSYFFDIEIISKRNSTIPHMLPSLKTFSQKMTDFNIHKNSLIIVYGKDNILGPARSWWMFKYFGFNNVKLLDGGLTKWKIEKNKTTDTKSTKYKSTFIFSINKDILVDKKNVLQNINNKKYIILDARNKERFLGKIKEPRKGVRSGHIPNSKNIYWKHLMKKNGEMKKNTHLKKVFNFEKIKDKKIICTCGSGISACALSLSLSHISDINSAVYDGSWAEWGKNKKLPIKNEI